MRSFHLLFLAAWLLMIGTPFAGAVLISDEEILAKNCDNLYTGDLSTEESRKEFDESFGASYENNTNGTCGTPNPLTNSLEKGDCTAEGDSITELIEPIGPEVELSSGDKVIDVYRGICCYAYSDVSAEETLCTDSRSIYTLTSSECSDNAAHCEKRQWLIGSGVGIVKIFVRLVYVWGAGIVGFVAVVVIVISGIQISVSGVSGDITSAKDRIIQSIAGLVLLFLSGIILYIINPTFFIE